MTSEAFVKMMFIPAGKDGRLMSPEEYGVYYESDQKQNELMNKAMFIARKDLDPGTRVRRFAYHQEDGVVVVVLTVEPDEGLPVISLDE